MTITASLIIDQQPLNVLNVTWESSMSFDFRLYNVFTWTLDLDLNLILASGHDEPTIYM